MNLLNKAAHKASILFIIFIYALAFCMLTSGLYFFHPDYNSDGDNENTTENICAENSEELQQGIANNIIRLHVIANSDSDADQSLKYRVRDRILSSLQSDLSDTSDITAARTVLLNSEDNIKKLAKKEIISLGYNYDVKVSLQTRYFPVKKYGDLIFSAGEYQAMCVEIGNATGHNWWCVLFPSLCFVDETYAVVPDESKQKLRNNLTEEEYDSLCTAAPSDEDSAENSNSDKKNTHIETHSAIYDWIASHF